MKLRPPHHFFILCLSVFVTGCGSLTDITNSPKAQAMSVLGDRLQTTESLELIKHKPSHTFRLVGSRHSEHHRERRIGQVKAGTMLKVNRVVRVKELVAILVFLPEYYFWDCALARIEDGPYKGKEVAVQGILLENRGIATLQSSYFKTITATNPAN